ncbi:hypothetical protein [Flavobacterium psychrotolerans]|uniref:Uncharacterized protein n=1 Tax=Flavobacterium psychrotolerans TaxID=2169410 RepID=A0A2U1JR62_9FLAO|nr:hypothetical protein [Flavobacterium psychrotolerans]PWA07318.1 hypothetical protein DB895_00935 [Flavobacterium psychrotolerans]
MKKLLGLLVSVLFLNGCDDGKLTVDTINFDDVAANACGEIIYKLNNNEALFVKIPTSENAFANQPTLPNAPTKIEIGGSVIMKYRFYNGKVSSDNICSLPAPISPSATEEWSASAGTIEITTTAVYSAANATTGALKISKYNHHIIIKNLVFAKPDGTNQKYESFNFGDYLTDATTLPLNFDPILVAQCTATPTIYNARNSGIESLVLENADADLIQNTGTVTKSISATTNKLVYRLYNTALPNTLSDYFCGTTPASPTIKEEWIATDGTIEVVNTTAGGFVHTITLKKVTFKKDNSTFYYGDAVIYGVLLTN